MDDEFQHIYNTFQPKILRYVIHLVGEHEAEDLTQEIFAKAAQALPDFRGESSLSTWLYRIATNAALDKLRSPSFQRQREVSVSIEQPDVEVADIDVWTGKRTPSAEQEVVRKEMDECLLDYIGRLPENYRTVLVLSLLEEFSNQEIADILGITLGTVKIRLHRAREKLQQELAANCDSYWVEDNEFVPNLRKPRKTP